LKIGKIKNNKISIILIKTGDSPKRHIQYRNQKREGLKEYKIVMNKIFIMINIRKIKLDLQMKKKNLMITLMLRI